MSSRVTQCPKCQTSFRVTDAQLEIANGAVRCGSCLHIFSAPEHWLGEEASTPAAPTPPKPEAENHLDDSFDDLLDDDDFLIGDDFDPDQLFAETDAASLTENEDDADSLTFQDTSQQTAIEINQNEELFPSEQPASNDKTKTKPGHDGQRVLEDTGQEAIITPSEGESFSGDDLVIDSELSDSFLEMDTWEESPTAVFKDLDELEDDTDTETDAWAEKLLEDEEAISSYTTPQADEVDLHPDFLAQAPEAPEAPELDPDLVALLNEAPEREYDMHSQTITDTDFDHPDIDPPDADHPNISHSNIGHTDIVEELSRDSNSSFSAGERIGEEDESLEPQPLISGIEPEPVELLKAQNRKNIGSRAWQLAALLAALALPYQYIQYNYDTLSRDETYRPLFKSLCGVTGCKLPQLHDIGLIKSSNLMVRSHPKASNALVVDAMMTNQAKFQQPFPLLELQFTDIDGQIIAGRRFAPSDYVAGELLGRNLMPAKQPIHISLAIIDPGSAAVNYQLRFLPPE